MSKRILVPLDPSKPMESVASLVGDIARSSHALVKLLHVAPQPANQVDDAGHVIAYADQEMASQEAKGLDYLHTVEVALGGVPAECSVRFGDPVKEILRESNSYGADLIVMGTAGRSGIKRVVLGSVAEAVFRRADVPVLLHRLPRAG